MITDFAALASRIETDVRFDSAAARLCHAVLDFYATRPTARRLLADQGQIRVAVACLYLQPHITLVGVQRLVPANIASANRVAAAMALLKGQQALVAGQACDRRTQPFRLSSAAVALFEAFVTMMVGSGAPFAASGIDPSRCRSWAEDFLLATLEGGGSLSSGPAVQRAQTLRGGALVNLELLRRGFEPEGQHPFSRKAFAGCFGLSRAQVIALVGELERTGWATLADGQLRPTPLAMQGGRVWLSRFMAIGAATLDGRFQAIMARSRAQVQAARAAASAVAPVD